MPVLRVSNRLWQEVTEVAGKEGVSLSYALDKILDEERRKVQELLDQLDQITQGKKEKGERVKAKRTKTRKAGKSDLVTLTD